MSFLFAGVLLLKKNVDALMWNWKTKTSTCDILLSSKNTDWKRAVSFWLKVKYLVRRGLLSPWATPVVCRSDWPRRWCGHFWRSVLSLSSTSSPRDWMTSGCRRWTLGWNTWFQGTLLVELGRSLLGLKSTRRTSFFMGNSSLPIIGIHFTWSDFQRISWITLRTMESACL